MIEQRMLVTMIAGTLLLGSISMSIVGCGADKPETELVTIGGTPYEMVRRLPEVGESFVVGGKAHVMQSKLTKDLYYDGRTYYNRNKIEGVIYRTQRAELDSVRRKLAEVQG